MNIKDIYRDTKPSLVNQINEIISELSKSNVPQQIKTTEISELSKEYISKFDSIMMNIEDFACAAIKNGIEKGADTIIKFAGDLISISENPYKGSNVRLIQGAPAFLAWRLLIISGALALELDEFNEATILITEPIEIEESNGLYSHQALVQRRRLFYPEAFLGYANYPIFYIGDYWENSEHIHGYFSDKENYRKCVARMLIVIALASSNKIPEEKHGQLYPGYRLLLPEARKAMNQLCGRIATKRDYAANISQVIGDTSNNLIETWDERASYLNEAKLGHDYMFNRLRFPIPIHSNTEQW